MAKELFILTQRNRPIGYYITSNAYRCGVIMTSVDNSTEKSFKEIMQDFEIECGNQGIEIYQVEEWESYDFL